MTTDVFFFLGVFIFIFVAWVATGGPERPISFAGPYLYPITTTGVSASAYGTGRAVDTSTKAGSIGSQLKDTRISIEELKKQISDLQAFGESSPYRGLVTIDHSTSGPSETDRKKEYVTIRLSSNSDIDVPITGWKLVSAATGVSAVIGDGTKTARTGHVNVDSPITLVPGDSAIIETGPSPIGDSFRENSCSGYLEQFQDFSPPLARSCPSPADEFAFYEGNSIKTGDECYAYLQKLPRCTIETDVPRDLPTACRNLVQDFINYNGCVNAHEREASFNGNVWRIFLSRNQEIWRSAHETIKLLDKDGKTVDLFAY